MEVEEGGSREAPALQAALRTEETAVWLLSCF